MLYTVLFPGRSKDQVSRILDKFDAVLPVKNCA